MSLQERLQEDLKTAMRQRDKVRSNVLRMLKAAIRNAEIDEQHALDDAGVLAVLNKAAKQRRESIDAYRQGGREDLVAAEEAELSIIEAYLPRQLEESEVRVAVEEAIVELGAQGPADMGRVMRFLMDKLRGQVDGKVVNAIVRETLAARKG
jgi:uncharacterized protein YqeY